LFLQVDVNGPSADPLFVFLKEKQGGMLGNDVKWYVCMNVAACNLGKDW
jgi:glutathione peroxidase-family protein